MPSFMGRRLTGALALQHLWGEGRHSAMIGTYGINARKFPDSLDPTGPTDRFRDVGVDAQYQYITDRHRFSTQLNWISERQDLDATLLRGRREQPIRPIADVQGQSHLLLRHQVRGDAGVLSHNRQRRRRSLQRGSRALVEQVAVLIDQEDLAPVTIHHLRDCAHRGSNASHGIVRRVERLARLFVVLGDDPVADHVEDIVLGADIVVDRALRHVGRSADVAHSRIVKALFD